MSNLIETLNWRYATKRMNGEKIPAEKLKVILEAIQLSPSSAGMQPYTVFVIEDQELKEKIQKVAYMQPQIAEASHLIVFASWTKITAEHIDEYMNLIAHTRGVSAESLDGFKTSITNGILSRPEEDNAQWAARQAYIALGHALVAAASEQIDATPMEGFDANGLDEILDLNEKGLHSVVIMTLGYRDAENDVLASAKKVRRSLEELFVTL
ncbi:NAD(P)H-dependent oxidoreductase [Dyadobacter frigoris]|uniref:NAD(P)H-dependent oxidoreductase n=1 Tax=Dyadobacter frigoris TaxID=2576211 RepID=A0A4U6D4N9_9BACT|nr:NAD(P)H-dependent oxidoreductase [Dyadobacter frigoris]TKT91646.1 NAD(P)H-dependent oxidoreductase [Dyadobacter frigoris]GLU51789.1 nitroreductase [Dyadobacter frigoris]